MESGFNPVIWLLMTLGWFALSIFTGQHFGYSYTQSFVYGGLTYLAIGYAWYLVGMTLFDRPSYDTSSMIPSAI
jgi:hypothetical protein